MSNYVLGYEELMKKLKAMNSIRFEGVVKKQVTQMYQRASKRSAGSGGTPYDTGELMENRFQQKMSSVTQKSMHRTWNTVTEQEAGSVSCPVSIICAVICRHSSRYLNKTWKRRLRELSMLKKLSFVDLVASIMSLLKTNTGEKVFDYVPVNEKSPLIYIEAAGKEPSDTKTMFFEIYKVNIHAVSEPYEGNTAIYNLINKIEEALTEDITLPEGFTLIFQISDGVNSIYDEPETKEKHAVLPVRFKVAYGYKIK